MARKKGASRRTGRRASTGMTRLFSRLPMTVVFLFVLAWAGATYFLQGKVVSVIDGDSLMVQVSFTEKLEVRLYGIDCPESKQRGGDAAAQKTRSLALFSPVKLEIMDTDQYGRKVAIVTLEDGSVLNEELLWDGQAWLYTPYCKDRRCKDWKILENAAREDRRGLWADNNPTPPWKWRQQNNRR